MIPASNSENDDASINPRSLVDRAYEEAMVRLGGAGRVQRTISLYETMARMIRHRIAQQNPDLSERELRLKVAEHMYQSDSQTLKLIRQAASK